MEKVNATSTQIGGDHYVKLFMQPVEFAVRADLTFIQGCIVKYITRYKFKNGKQDIEKARHFAQLAIELVDVGPEVPNLGLAYTYCKANRLSPMQSSIVIATINCDYYKVIWFCNKILKQEFS